MPDEALELYDYQLAQEQGIMPPDATVVERDAQGNPSVAEWGGEKYYLPGSTMFEVGYRTESERLRYDKFGNPLGPHPGNLIPEGTVLIMEGNKPTRRITSQEIAKGERDISADIAAGTIRIPVKNDRGGETLLTIEQARRIADTTDDKAAFDLYKEYGVVQPWTKYTTRDAAEASRKAAAASEFVSKAESKQQAKAQESLKKYKDKDGYNLADALAAGVSPSVIMAAGFTKQQIDEQKQAVKFLQATPEQQFIIMRAHGQVPKDAEFVEKDKQGNFVYTTNTRPKTIHDFVVSTSDEVTTSNLAMMPTTSEANRQLYADTAKAWGKYVVSGLPVVGTVVMWNRMSVPWIVTSVATDLLFFAPVLRAAGTGIRSAAMGRINQTAKEAEAAVAAGRSVERATLKEVGNKQVVKTYDAWTKAQDAYTKNLTEIKAAEWKIKNTPGGPLPEYFVDLEMAQKATGGLKNRLVMAGDALGREQAKLATQLQPAKLGKTAAFDTGPLADLGKQSAKDIETTAARIFEGKTPSLETLAKREKAINKSIEMAAFDKNFKEVGRLKQKLIDIQGQKIEAKAAQAMNLYNERLANLSRIEAIDRELKNPTAATARNINKLQNEKLVLKKRVIALDNQLPDAIKALSIEYAEPIQRAGGQRIATATPKAPPGRYLGGGARTAETGRMTTLAVPGAKLLYRSTEGMEEWQIPAVRTIEAPGKQTVTVEPQPYWAGEVTTAPRTKPVEPTTPFQPETKPAPRPPFNPKPGEITWTPAVVLSPRIKGKELVITVAGARALTQAQTAAAKKAAAEYMNAVATGEKPNIAARNITDTKTGIVVKVVSKTADKNITQLATSTQTSTRPELTVKTETIPVIRTPTIPIKEPPPKIFPPSGATDKQKRQFLDRTAGLIARRRGSLGGKSVWRVWHYPYRPQDKLVIVGPPPAGARVVTGKGSVGQSATVIKGLAPTSPLYDDTGAVDDLIIPTGKNDIRIQSVRDKGISERTPRISGGSLRISPKMPRLR